MRMVKAKHRKQLGKLIEEARRKNEMIQSELAKELGVSQGTVSKIEKGIQLPTLQIGFRICRLFNIPYCELEAVVEGYEVS